MKKTLTLLILTFSLFYAQLSSADNGYCAYYAPSSPCNKSYPSATKDEACKHYTATVSTVNFYSESLDECRRYKAGAPNGEKFGDNGVFVRIYACSTNQEVINNSCVCKTGFTETPSGCTANTPVPFQAELVGTVVAVGGVILAVVGAIAAAPVVLAGGIAAAAMGALVALTDTTSDGEANTAQNNLNNSNLPLNVSLAPAPSGSATNNNTTPQINKNPDGFQSAGGASGSWDSSGATGTWENNPDGSQAYVSKGTDGSKITHATISPDKSEIQILTMPTSSTTAPTAVNVKTQTDGSTNISHAANLQVSDGNGNTSTQALGVVRSYKPNGDIISSQTISSDMQGSGAPSNLNTSTSYGLPPSGNTGNCADTNTCGTCPDCALEVTQLQNKALLSQISSDLKSTETVTSDIEAYGNKTDDDFVNLIMDNNPLSPLMNYTLPAHSSACPTIDLDLSLIQSGTTKQLNSHCAFMADSQALAQIIFTALYLGIAFFIVLRG